MINNFESWFNKTNKSTIKEDAAVTPEVSDKNTAVSGRKGMMHDVDTIMTSLDALSIELTEELEAIEEELNEAGAVDFIKSWLTSMKATKAQKKVNKIKMNAADLEFASKNFEGDKKKKTEAKSVQVNQQAKDLQTMVDDKFKGKGDIVDAKLAKTKIEGQIEIIKRTSGMEDDPNKQSDMKTKLKELTNKYKEETEAINALEDSNDEAIKAEKKRQQDKLDAEKGEGTPEEGTPEEEAKKKAAEEAKKKAAAEKAEAERVAGLTDEERAAEEEAKKKAAAEEEAKKKAEAEKAAAEEEAKKKAEAEKAEEERVAGLTDEERAAEEEAKKKAAEEEAKKKAEAAAKIKAEEERVAGLTDEERAAEEEAKKKAAEEAKKKKEALEDSVQIDNDLITRARNLNLNELATEIESKLDWQVAEGSVLRSNYEAIIKKAESDQILNESKYQVNSIKDAFKRLM